MRLSYVVGIGMGGLALAAIWSLYNAFMPLLLADFVSSRALRGVIMGLDNALAVLLIPVVGAWSDKVEGPFGKRLPFLVVGMPLAALLFALLPLANGALWSLLAVDVFFLLSMMVFRAPLAALMPDHVPPDKRSGANGVLTFMGALGGAFALLALAPAFDRLQWLPFAGASALLVASLLVIWLTADRKPKHVETGSAADEAPLLSSYAAGLRLLFVRENLGGGLVLVALFAFFLGFSALEAQFSTFATEHLGATAGTAGRLLGLTLAAFLAMSLPAGWLAGRFGEFKVMTIGAVPLAIVAVLMAVIDRPSAIPYLLALAGVFWSLIVVPAYPLVVSLAGSERTGFLTGIYFLFGSGAAIIGPGLIGGLMDIFGNRALFVAIAAAVAGGAAVLAVARPLVRSSARGTAGGVNPSEA